MLSNITKAINDDLKWKTNERRRIMQKEWGFQFYKEKWEEYNIEIGFIFNKKHLEDCNFGFRKYDPDNKFIPEYYAHEYTDKEPIENIWYSLEPMPEKHGKNEENYRMWYRDLFYQFMPDYNGEQNFYNFMVEKVGDMCKEIECKIIPKASFSQKV
jgi:hypothetical protein